MFIFRTNVFTCSACAILTFHRLSMLSLGIYTHIYTVPADTYAYMFACYGFPLDNLDNQHMLVMCLIFVLYEIVCLDCVTLLLWIVMSRCPCSFLFLHLCSTTSRYLLDCLIIRSLEISV